MTQFLLLIALFSPQVDGGFRVGGGLLEEAPIVLVQPWIGAQWDRLQFALGPPIRMDLDAGQIRTKDWDETADYGRILHWLQWGDTLRAGVISHRSLANGTLVRRYHNHVDIDHPRLGLEIRLDMQPPRRWMPDYYELMIDQILAQPVMGGALGYMDDKGHLLMQGAADFAYPAHIDGGLDDTGWPRSTRMMRGGVGLSGRFQLWAPNERYTVSLLGDADMLTTRAWGTHLGVELEVDDGRDWRVELASNLMILGENYTWSLFDTGYLIDRWRGISDELAVAKQALGSRSNLQVTYADSVIVGTHYADAQQAGRADLGAWVRVPFKRATVGAYWRVRRVQAGAAFFDFDEVLAALSAHATLTHPLSVEFTLSRDWFAQPSGRYAPHTSALLSVEARWSN